MEIHKIAKAVETVGWFMGGWPMAQPLLEKIMHNNGITGVGFFMRDGAYYQIRFEVK